MLEVGDLIDKWVEEIEAGIELEENEEWEAWDDVKGVALPLEKVNAAMGRSADSGTLHPQVSTQPQRPKPQVTKSQRTR